jgi:hypothetical protein
MVAIQNWTRIGHLTKTAVTSQEQAARERLHIAIEQAVAEYMAASRVQDIAGVELFPCDASCIHCLEAA